MSRFLLSLVPVVKSWGSIILILFSTVVAWGQESARDSAGADDHSAQNAANGRQITLDEAIQTALQNNLSLKAASSGARSASWGVKRAYLDFLPQVNFDFRYARLDAGTLERANAFYNFVNDPDNATVLPEELRRNVRPGAWADSYGPSVSVIQPIYNGGVQQSQLGLAQAQDLQSQANWEETRQLVILNTQVAYFDVLKAQELVALAEESLRSTQQHLSTAQKMLDVGLRSRSEVLRFEVQVANAENNQVVAQNGLELAKAALNQVMGFELEREVAPAPVEDFTWEAPRTLDEQMAVALRRHPGLQVMKSRVEVQNASLGIARSGFLPKVNLAYNYSWEANDTWAFDSYKTWSLGITASIPVFNSFQNYASLQKEREALNQVEAMQNDYTRGLQLQVKQASLNLGAAQKRMAITSKAVEEANENMRIVRNSYEVGLLSSLDLIDAEVANTQAKNNQIEARFDFFLAKAQLARAMGVLGR